MMRTSPHAAIPYVPCARCVMSTRPACAVRVSGQWRVECEAGQRASSCWRREERGWCDATSRGAALSTRQASEAVRWKVGAVNTPRDSDRCAGMQQRRLAVVVRA